MGERAGEYGETRLSGFGCENDTRSFFGGYFRLAWVLNWDKVAKYVRRVHNQPLTGIV